LSISVITCLAGVERAYDGWKRQTRVQMKKGYQRH
jgi:hypothetical protein